MKKAIAMGIVVLLLVGGLAGLTSTYKVNTLDINTLDVEGDTGTFGEISSEENTVPSAVSWESLVDPSLIDSIHSEPKSLADVTVLTKRPGLLNGYYSREIYEPMEKVKKTSVPVRDTVSDVAVTRNIRVPYGDISSIAQLPGVIGIYRTEKPEPAVINDPILEKENSGIRTTNFPEDPVSPDSYPTAVEHNADAAWAKGYTGAGVNVAVVDTGVDFANPDLMGQWAVDNNASSPYYGWPIMWDPVSMDVMMAYFTADSDSNRYPYPIFATWGDVSWYSDTTYEVQADYNSSTDRYTLEYSWFGGLGYPNKRANPNGYGGTANTSLIDRTYYIGDSSNHIVSQSGIYHMGITKDDYLTTIYGTRLGILVVDSTTAGVYDTVYVDLDNDGDFTDENPVNKTNPLAYQDVNGDGVPDISGGLLYFISNTMGTVNGEHLTITNGSAWLAHQDIVTQVGPSYSLQPTNKLYIDGNYLPSYSEEIVQYITDSPISEGSIFYLNSTSIGRTNYMNVDFQYLAAINYHASEGRYSLYYINSTDYYEMTESSTAGFLHYTFDRYTGKIQILFDTEPGSQIEIQYHMDTYRIHYSRGKISFLSLPPSGASVTADYQYGLPIPYSDTYTERMGYDNFIPASGDVVCFFGDFDIDQGFPHGTFCASNIVGTMNNIVQGTAPGAKIIGIGDFYNYNGYYPWYFAVEGYDGVPDTGDEAQIVSNSFGSGTVNTGWTYSSRLVYQITRSYAPNTTFVVSAGNEGWGYGTVGNPGASPGVVTVGAGINMAYRWLFGYDGGEPNDWQNYYYPDSSWYGDIAGFSSKGPTALGTPDPDVLAAGEFGIGGAPVNYATTSWGYVDGTRAWDLWSGTSLAAPVTAGVMALEYQAYYSAHGAWPGNREAQHILTSSCDDHGYDVLQQGAGWLNASRAVDMAAEATGVSADRMYWTPGGYDGESHDMFMNMVRPGENDTTTMTLSNHDTSSSTTVVVTDETYSRESYYTIDFPVSGIRDAVLKPDGLYDSDGATLIDGNLWTSSEWDNADFMKITAYVDTEAHPDQSDAYPYMNLYDWIDREHYGGNETAFYAEIIHVNNESVITGQYGETYAYIDNLPVVPGEPVLIYSDGRLLDNSTGGNYTFDAATGKITFLDDAGNLRPLNSGEVITATYTYYLEVRSGDTYYTHDSVTRYTVWLTDKDGKIYNWTSRLGSYYTYNTASGEFTLLVDLLPGDRVNIDYYWDNAGEYDGRLERIRMNMDLQPANLVTASIYNPVERVDDGLVLDMMDVNWAYIGGDLKTYNFTIMVEFYDKTDWNWITEANVVNISAGGTATVNITATVPADAGVGSYQGAIVLYSSSGKTVIPVLINVPATEFPVHFGGNTPTTTLYENGAMQGIHGGEYTGGGDWRFFFVDVRNLSVSDGMKILTAIYWSGMQDDTEIYLMEAQEDTYFPPTGEYGPFAMREIARTEEIIGYTNTNSNLSEILAANTSSGPFEIALRNWRVTGSVPYTDFHGDMGRMMATPSDIVLHTDELKANATVGHPYPIDVYSDIELPDGISALSTIQNTTLFSAQPVDPYPYSGGAFEAYLAAAPNEVVYDMPSGIIRATFTMYFYNGARDVDMGIFYDANDDGVAQANELVVDTSETATAGNPEVGTVLNPEAGRYIIKAAGYDVDTGSLYDLTVDTYSYGEDPYFSIDAPDTTVPAGTNTTVYLNWDFGNDIPEDAVTSLMCISPGFAPDSMAIPIDIEYTYYYNISLHTGWNLISIPWLSGPTNISSALPGLSWDRAMVYLNGTWHTCNLNRDQRYNLDFPDVDAGMGIWVNITAASNLRGPITGIIGRTTHLNAGWNLVSYNGKHDMKVSEAMGGLPYTHLETADLQANLYSLSGEDYMIVGRAYWIYVEQDTSWTL